MSFSVEVSGTRAHRPAAPAELRATPVTDGPGLPLTPYEARRGDVNDRRGEAAIAHGVLAAPTGACGTPRRNAAPRRATSGPPPP